MAHKWMLPTLSIEFKSAPTMPTVKIQAKISRNYDPQAYAPKAGPAPATVLCNANYFGIFRKVAKTYYEAQMIRRIFLSNEPAVRSPPDTVVSFVSTSLWESFEQKEPQRSVIRYRAQPTCTVYQPSVARNRQSRHVQCTHLPQ